MKIKLKELEQMRQSIKTISQKEMPIKTSYKISKAMKKLSEENDLFETKRLELADKYAQEKDEKGKAKVEENGTIKIDMSRSEEFKKEMDELLDIEFVLDFEPIEIAELGEINIKPADLIGLEMLIK